MAQLHFYVPDDVEKLLRMQAQNARLPLSRFLADLVKQQTVRQTGWPDGYLDQVFGCWEGEPLQREPEGDLEERSRIG